jgi:type VI secretion system protein ImpL
VKRILIGILIFLVYLALVIWGGFALHFEDTKLVLFCVILGLLGALTIGFVVWYLYKLSKANEESAGPDTPDAVNLNTLLRDADARIRQAGRAGVKSLASMPLIYVIGDENSAKTQTVLQSGLDPELLAGNVFQDGMIVPTQLANLWLAGNYVIAEAGGALLRHPPLWARLLKATIPARLGSAFSSDSRLPARSVVVCVSIERILAPNTSEQIRALAQTLNERLRQLSQTLGISLPIYVLFTKLDNVTPFAEYVSHLSEEEVKLPIGSLLPSLHSGSGLYTEQATALISGRFDQLLYALSEFRLDILSRGGELQELARAYEFPRDLRKLRAGIVSGGCPSQPNRSQSIPARLLFRRNASPSGRRCPRHRPSSTASFRPLIRRWGNAHLFTGRGPRPASPGPARQARRHTQGSTVGLSSPPVFEDTAGR